MFVVCGRLVPHSLVPAHRDHGTITGSVIIVGYRAPDRGRLL